MKEGDYSIASAIQWADVSRYAVERLASYSACKGKRKELLRLAEVLNELQQSLFAELNQDEEEEA